MILFTTMVCLVCLVLVLVVCLPDWLVWEDKLGVAIVVTMLISVVGLVCGSMWVALCSAINWTIQHILT